MYDWVRTFTPRCIDAARAYRATVGTRWRVDETHLKIGTRWHYLFRAIDARGQIVDVYLSERRNRAAAEAFFEAAIATNTVTPTRVTSEKATCYPPVLRTVLPNIGHRTSKYLNNGLERDHQHLKGRLRPMRWFKTIAGASSFCHGHTLIRNLRRGFSTLTTSVSIYLRLATAWAILALTCNPKRPNAGARPSPSRPQSEWQLRRFAELGGDELDGLRRIDTTTTIEPVRSVARSF